ncbi:hypothetical protein B296_00020420 [Ensete ventricosum]|uniref:Uncharacterized protein n=1 Tax=Ensete ventricosum TaxID=4639 RepID=A0A426Y9P9_ENSVE|nr:hypothetical protein B296_00020420 [Ensete ventricosum]
MVLQRQVFHVYALKLAPDKSFDHPHMEIYRSRRKGYRYKATDSRAMGLVRHVEYPSSLTYLAEELRISSFDYSTIVAESGWKLKERVVAKGED